ncbi:MAG TPA: acyltransferase [Saprospiraceae bacterium]|nr:acyltransferase [Saprospiraceae bacterium]
MIKWICTGYAWIRYLFFYIWNLGRLKGHWYSLCFGGSQIAISKSGRLILNGKLCLSGGCELRALGSIRMGKNVYLNKYSRIIAHEDIEIGDDVWIAQFVSILDHEHRRIYDHKGMHFDGYRTEPIRIGSHVLIGDKVTILKGSRIGDHVVIGANCVIKGDIPSYSIVSGPDPLVRPAPVVSS